MPLSLERFGLSEQLRCSALVRRATDGTATMEAAAREICRCLYDELREGEHGTRAAALVRCYKTHPYAGLPLDLQRFARSMLPVRERPRGTLRCLTLLASAGDEPSWNTRQGSQGHRAVPLPSPDFIERAPMIAQLVRAFGLDFADVVAPPEDVMRDRKGKNYGVFHVEQALGSPYIPAQSDFVRRHAIRSVVGFGGALVSGDLFAVIVFARVPVSAEVADRFRKLALDVKTAFFAFDDGQVFDPMLDIGGSATPADTLRV
jgi:hypothetical protein